MYAPPDSDIPFLKKNIGMMVSETVGPLICGGDLTINLEPELDISNRNVQHTKSSKTKKIKILLNNRFFFF